MATVPTPKRGEVWLVRFDPSAGAEIRKVRPAVVVNLDAIGRLPLRIVVPITDWKSDFGNLSWFVFLPAASENGLSKQRPKTGLEPSRVVLYAFAQHSVVQGDPLERHGGRHDAPSLASRHRLQTLGT